MRSFGFGEGLEPLRDLVEILAPGGLGHARIHLRVLEGLTGHGGSQIHVGGADRLVRRRITGGLQEVEVAVGMPGLGLGGVAKQAPDVGIALDVRLPREIEIAAVGLGLSGKGGLEVLVCSP